MKHTFVLDMLDKPQETEIWENQAILNYCQSSLIHVEVFSIILFKPV
jgi:hypothetical protein